MLQSFFSLSIAFLIVAFGQPAWVGWLCPIAAAVGYAICWDALRNLSIRSNYRFLIAFIWYAGVQTIQLSWMTATEFHGAYILGVYLGLCVCLGLLFAIFSVFLFSKPSLSLLRIGALAGIWTMMEWGRFHIMCGFSWNPAGMALAAYPLSMQLAAITGVLGLSFWVMLTNLVALKELWKRKRPREGFLRWLGVALVPYVFGSIFWSFHHPVEDKKVESKVALVQTGLLPSQKFPLQGRIKEFLSPLVQWQRIFTFLKECEVNKPSLIVMPEYTIPFASSQPIYDSQTAIALLKDAFGIAALKALPPLQHPFAAIREDGKGTQCHLVSNSYFSQFLANFYQADVIIGMEDRDAETKKCYSAGLHFSPDQGGPQRYEKQVLLPLAEYLPFEWCRRLVAGYGISDFYTPGTESKVFIGKRPFSVSICYEETFPEIMREGKAKGAELFVNLTNDNWYPNSKLAKQHFDHGRLRAVENGIPIVRACNSGITAVIGPRGEIVDQLQQKEGVLYANIPQYTFFTPYVKWGDTLILGISLGLLCSYLLFQKWLIKVFRKRRESTL